ncbi:MAG: tetratricopeptide repeat protein, partial [Geminicoccaceae bacterium]
ANRWYRKAADAGYATAMRFLGNNYARGTGIEADPVEASRWYRMAADAGDTTAMRILGSRYESGTGVEADPTEVHRWYRKAADAGDVVGMLNLGVTYFNGIGVEADPKEANLWYRMAADGGSATAMRFLGNNYDNGIGVEADPAEAHGWYRKAADAGDVVGMLNLGVTYENGTGVEASARKANGWYRKAADAGDATAMRFLGNSYAQGKGVAADPKEANRWYRKAADVGDTTAMRFLAHNALVGNGFDGVEIAEAVHWARRAKEAGDTDVEAILRSIERTVPQEPRIETALAGLRDVNWPLEPLVPGDWQPLEGERAQDAVSAVLSFAAIGEHRGLMLRALRKYAPDFYPGCDLIEAIFEAGDEQCIACVLVGADQGILLDGTSRPVHAFNQTGHLDLSTTKRCVDYLRFFCMAVCADEGHFRIIEALDPEWLEAALDDSDAGKLADAIKPVAITAETADRCTVTATVKYSTALFHSTFAVARNGAQPGMVEMLDDEPFESDLPFLWEGFDGSFRKRLPRSNEKPDKTG